MAVTIDSLLLIYDIVASIIISQNGAYCYINDNKNFPYTRAMVDDPDKFPYASDPAP